MCRVQSECLHLGCKVPPCSPHQLQLPSQPSSRWPNTQHHPELPGHRPMSVLLHLLLLRQLPFLLCLSRACSSCHSCSLSVLTAFSRLPQQTDRQTDCSLLVLLLALFSWLAPHSPAQHCLPQCTRSSVSSEGLVRLTVPRRLGRHFIHLCIRPVHLVPINPS